jgi:hypothetical protein
MTGKGDATTHLALNSLIGEAPENENVNPYQLRAGERKGTGALVRLTFNVACGATTWHGAS